MTVFSDFLTAIPLSGGLVLYFYFRPEFPIEIAFAFWGIFVFSYFLDVHITVCNSSLMGYEKNIIFPILYKKYGYKISPIIQYVLEILLVILFPFFFITKVGFFDVSVIAFVFGVSHLLGYFSNKKIIKLMKNDTYMKA